MLLRWQYWYSRLLSEPLEALPHRLWREFPMSTGAPFTAHASPCRGNVMRLAFERSPVYINSRFWFVDQIRDELQRQRGSLAFNLKFECSRVGQKASTVSGQFKERYFITIRKYGLQQRMQYAREKVEAEPGCHLSNLAKELGYSHENAFSRVFRAYWNLSPRECAQQVGSMRAMSAGGTF